MRKAVVVPIIAVMVAACTISAAYAYVASYDDSFEGQGVPKHFIVELLGEDGSSWSGSTWSSSIDVDVTNCSHSLYISVNVSGLSSLNGTLITFLVGKTVVSGIVNDGKVSVPSGIEDGTAAIYLVSGTGGTATVSGAINVSNPVSDGKVSVPDSIADGTIVTYTANGTTGSSTVNDHKITVPGLADGTIVTVISGGKVSVPDSITDGTVVTYFADSHDGTATVSGGKISIPNTANGTVVTYIAGRTVGTSVVSDSAISVPDSIAHGTVVTTIIGGDIGSAKVSEGTASVTGFEYDGGDGTFTVRAILPGETPWPNTASMTVTMVAGTS